MMVRCPIANLLHVVSDGKNKLFSWTHRNAIHGIFLLLTKATMKYTAMLTAMSSR